MSTWHLALAEAIKKVDSSQLPWSTRKFIVNQLRDLMGYVKSANGDLVNWNLAIDAAIKKVKQAKVHEERDDKTIIENAKHAQTKLVTELEKLKR